MLLTTQPEAITNPTPAKVASSKEKLALSVFAAREEPSRNRDQVAENDARFSNRQIIFQHSLAYNFIFAVIL